MRSWQDVVHQVGNLGAAPLLTLHIYAPPLPVDQPSPSDGRQVVILGGGWSGTALAIHLLASGDPALRVHLVEAGPDIGRGVAFGTEDHGHILNVAAIGMSLDPTQPDDVVQLTRARGVEATADSPLSRRLYGDYVQHRLARAITSSPSKLRLARSSATRVTAGGRRWQVELADGRRLDADEVVLATGHGPSKVPPAFSALPQDPRLIIDPWTPGALAAIPPTDRVLVIGTGLTAVDVLQTLRRQGHATPVHAASRHGRWPRPHLPQVRWTGAKVELPIADAPRTADGSLSGLWALGGLQRPRWFESTAVPVRSGQVAALARLLAPPQLRGAADVGVVGVQPLQERQSGSPAARVRHYLRHRA